MRKKKDENHGPLYVEPNARDPKWLHEILKILRMKFPETFKSEKLRCRDEWQRAQLSLTQKHYDEQVVETLTWVAMVCLQNGDYNAAIRYCRKGLEDIDPLSEELRMLHAQASLMRDKAMQAKMHDRKGEK